MCEATSGSAAPTICNCHHSMTKLVLKLEVDKTYLTRNNTRVKVLFYNEGRYIGQAQDTRKYYEFHSNGLSVDQAVCSDLVSEYKEPEYWYINVYSYGSVNQLKPESVRNDQCRLFTIRIDKQTKAVEKLS